MKAAASPRALVRACQAGAAAVELAVIISATIVVLPALVLFAKVFFQYSVIKSATHDAATYLATLPVAAVMDETERLRAIGIAERIVADAALGAELTGATTLGTTVIECDDHGCSGEVPEVFTVTSTITINDTRFNGLTSAWTNDATQSWEVSAKSTVPFSK